MYLKRRIVKEVLDDGYVRYRVIRKPWYSKKWKTEKYQRDIFGFYKEDALFADLETAKLYLSGKFGYMIIKQTRIDGTPKSISIFNQTH